MMSDYVQALLTQQHVDEMLRAREAQRLANLVQGERPRRRWSLRPLVHSAHHAMRAVSRGLSLRGLWMTSARRAGAKAELTVVDC